MILERPKEPEPEKTDEANSDAGGFAEGFKEGLQPGFYAAKENIDEFNRIINGEETTDDQNKE